MAGKRKDRSEREVNELLDRILEGRTPDEIVGSGGLLDDLTKRLMERALEGELTDHLGYEKHAAEGRDGGNSRNGRTKKRVKTGTSELELEVPRDRDATFDPKLVRKGQRRLPGFDEKVIALYARGMTTREIQGHLKELYRVEVSPSLISAVTDAVLEDVKAWQGRPLEAVYPIVYLDAIHVKVRAQGHVQTHAVYLALALTLEGNKELLGLWVGAAEGAKFWLAVLTELKNRGVRDILIAAIDGLKGFPEAIESVFPNTQKALETFAERWDGRFPMISRKWRENWTNLTPFFDYPPEIRKVMYTTNAIEGLNAQLTKVTKKRGAFPTPEAVRKVLYLAIERASERWTRPVQDWPAALNHLSIVFEGRVPV